MHFFLPMLMSAFSCLFLFSSLLASEDLPRGIQEKRKIKTLILIIATDDKPAYREFQKVWESYMNSDPEHFEAYFIRADQNLPAKYQIKKNEIIVKTPEGFAPGIINKTIMSLEALQSRLNEFDYVVRTNLSSFYAYPRLLAFLQSIPKTNVYRGVSLYPCELPQEFLQIPFVSGAGIILSKDLAEMLVKEHHAFEKYKAELPDDVFIGMFFQKKNITPMQASRSDFPNRAAWQAGKNNLPADAFHFRAKSHHCFRMDEENYEDELFILHELLNMFYPQSEHSNS